MIIQNFEDLALNDKKKDCLEILDAGLASSKSEKYSVRICQTNRNQNWKKINKIFRLF